MQLTQQQKNFFHTFGYLAFPGLLNDRIDQIIEDFEETWRRIGGGHAGKPHDGTQRSCTSMYQHERMVTLLDDPRIVGIASSLLGDDYNFTGGDGNYYVGDTGWHSDGWYKDITHIKIAFYLDPVTKDSGCLRVIPGSHRTQDSFAQDLSRLLGRSNEALGVDGNQIPAIPLETKPGDVILFHHNTKHAAYHGSKRRRMFTMNLSQHYPEHMIQDLKDMLAGAARFWAMEPYNKEVIASAGPERMKHLKQIIDNFGHVPALSRKMMETMAEPARG